MSCINHHECIARKLFYYDLVDRVRRLHEGRMIAEQRIAQQNAKEQDAKNVAAFEVQMQQASGKLFL